MSLAVGAAISVVLWLLTSGGLAIYVAGAAVTIWVTTGAVIRELSGTLVYAPGMVRCGDAQVRWVGDMPGSTNDGSPNKRPTTGYEISDTTSSPVG